MDADRQGVKIRNIMKTGTGDVMFEVDGQRKDANIPKDEIHYGYR